MSGLDQAWLHTDADWQHIDKLDQKLWMALSCPTTGLEFDPDTLAILDSDADGRIRAADISEAVAWVCRRVNHPAWLTKGGRTFPLENLREDTEEGKELISAARLALDKNGSRERGEIGFAEVDQTLAEAAAYPFNGDGVVTLGSIVHDDNQAAFFLRAGLAVVGGKRDVSGQPGLDSELAAEFRKRLQAEQSFREKVKETSLPLHEKTAQAWLLISRLQAKIDDYFDRCRMAAFAPGTVAALNDEQLLEKAGLSSLGGEKTINGTTFGYLPEILSGMPIAHIAADRDLPLKENLNPAWSEDIEELGKLLAPIIGSGTSLSRQKWQEIKNIFSPFAKILESKPFFPLPPEDAERVLIPDLPELALAPSDDKFGRQFLPCAPNESLENLKDSEITELLSPETATAFEKVVQEDLSAPKLDSIRDLRKLLLFQAHLYTFMMNFVSFIDFYEPDKRAIFQTGTLYLDSRACYLCVPVQDVENHARLAAQSQLCLIYCQCERKKTDGATDTRVIAAALTAGNLVSLIEGRNGLFVDNNGLEWDCRIIKICHNPISLREAILAPYVRAANMIGEQIHKFAAKKEEETGKAGNTAAVSLLSKPDPAAPPKQGFDFAKGAGIFAAVSVALSVLSAAFAYIANSLAALGWWWPLALVGIFICISGPSVFLAWLKLRHRCLGPLLDASGWAVNKGAPINLLLGKTLTSVGRMPQSAQRDINDPYGLPASLHRNRVWFWLFLLAAICVAGCLCYFHFHGYPPFLEQLKSLCISAK